MQYYVLEKFAWGFQQLNCVKLVVCTQRVHFVFRAFYSEILLMLGMIRVTSTYMSFIMQLKSMNSRQNFWRLLKTLVELVIFISRTSVTTSVWYSLLENNFVSQNLVIAILGSYSYRKGIIIIIPAYISLSQYD